MGNDNGNNEWPKELLGEGDVTRALLVKGPGFETQLLHYF